MVRGGDWIIGQLGMHNAGALWLALCRVFRCHTGAIRLLWRRVRSQVVTRGGAAGDLLSSYSWVSLSPSNSITSERKEASYNWGGWGTKEPQTQSLAPPHSSFQNFSYHLTHKQKQEGTPSILGPPPFSPRSML